MFRRIVRVTFKLGLIAAVGVGVAMLLRKLTAPTDAELPIEPWPPLPGESAGSTTPAGESTSSNGEAGASADTTPIR